MLIGALEAGGTKMVCAIGKKDGTILEQVSIPTTTPEETIPKLIEYFKDKEIEALGVAAFGPVDVKPESETYGYILDTPKLAWRHKDFLGRLKAELKVPMGLDTDVNGSCLGEVTYGCARGLDSVIYITIGTGVGVGVCINGKLLHGMLHPEGGHILLARHEDDSKGGICPYHKNCLEGFASGPSIEPDGVKRPWNWWTGPRYGRWKAITLPRPLWTISCCFLPRKLFWARSHASGTAVPYDPPKGERDVKRLYQDKGTGRHGQLHCSGKPSR